MSYKTKAEPGIVYFAIRMTSTLREKIRRAATKAGRPASTFCRLLLQSALSQIQPFVKIMQRSQVEKKRAMRELASRSFSRVAK